MYFLFGRYLEPYYCLNGVASAALLAAILSTSGCYSYDLAKALPNSVAPPQIAMPAVATGLDFASAKHLADTEPRDDAYIQRWLAANNSQYLDEKDGCYFKSPGPLGQVLVIDASGEVTEVISDRDNAKAACFRGSYLHAHFPQPPSAPYYQYLYMADPHPH